MFIVCNLCDKFIDKDMFYYLSQCFDVLVAIRKSFAIKMTLQKE